MKSLATERTPDGRMIGHVEGLHAILDTVPDAMIVTDERGRILSFSIGAEKMFGFRERDLVGENVSALMPSPDRERHDGYIRHYRQTGEKRIIGIGRVTTARHRDGSTFPVDLAINETRIDGERVFVGFLRDLTERRETEKRLHGLQADLAHASRISAMGTLAASIAHELNQPLTAIANYAEAARDLLAENDAPGTEEIARALDECSAEAMRAGAIVRKLRDFISRGETERRIASLERLATEATALALINGEGRDIEFETRLDPDADRVLVEPVQIQQVLLNLIRNAVEAMEDASAKRIEIASRKTGDGFVEVTVADSGPGLDKRVAARLFHPFVSTKESGMGLGLSICHTIVNGHGGRIWAEPSALGGTIFHFTLIDADDTDDERDG